jgi:hypothetical protein
VARVLKVSQTQFERIKDYVATFNTDAGQRVLEDLEAEYGGECHVRGNHYETLHRSSNRDFLERIKWLLKMADRVEIEKEE